MSYWEEWVFIFCRKSWLISSLSNPEIDACCQVGQREQRKENQATGGKALRDCIYYSSKWEIYVLHFWLIFRLCKHFRVTFSLISWKLTINFIKLLICTFSIVNTVWEGKMCCNLHIFQWVYQVIKWEKQMILGLLLISILTFDVIILLQLLRRHQCQIPHGRWTL